MTLKILASWMFELKRDLHRRLNGFVALLDEKQWPR
jgi:hypothetical protein